MGDVALSALMRALMSADLPADVQKQRIMNRCGCRLSVGPLLWRAGLAICHLPLVMCCALLAACGQAGAGLQATFPTRWRV